MAQKETDSNIKADEDILAGFFGEFDHTLDSQRRLAIPSIWRKKSSGGSLYLVPGRNKTLQLIPYLTFKTFLNKVRSISFADAKLSLALAQFGAKVQECIPDKQGRIQIPQRLLEYAGIKEQVTMVGAVSVIQIWLPERWKENKISDDLCLDMVQQIGETPDSFESVLQSLTGIKGKN